ncbi:MAG: hypothetical protein K5637_07015 [Lachnospiraceae bacterium]|nr:hypothetical protein [Lachnospiraceae bacterium]
MLKNIKTILSVSLVVAAASFSACSNASKSSDSPSSEDISSTESAVETESEAGMSESVSETESEEPSFTDPFMESDVDQDSYEQYGSEAAALAEAYFVLDDVRGFTGYEPVLFKKGWESSCEDGSSLELYYFDYAYSVNDPDDLLLADAMYFDEDGNIRKFCYGELAVKLQDGSLVSSAIMLNDEKVYPAFDGEETAKDFIEQKLDKAAENDKVLAAIRECSSVDLESFEKYGGKVSEWADHCFEVQKDVFGFTGYEIALFEKAWEGTDDNGSTYSLYYYEYAFSVNDPGEYPLIYSMYLDEDMHVRGHLYGELAVKTEDGELTASALVTSGELIYPESLNDNGTGVLSQLFNGS